MEKGQLLHLIHTLEIELKTKSLNKDTINKLHEELNNAHMKLSKIS